MISSCDSKARINENENHANLVVKRTKDETIYKLESDETV